MAQKPKSKPRPAAKTAAARLNSRDLTLPPPASVRRLKLMNLAYGVWFAATAVSMLLAGRNDAGDRGLFTPHLAVDQLQSAVAGHPVYVQAAHRLLDINLAYLLALLFAAVTVMHALRLLALRDRSGAELEARLRQLRTVEACVAGGLLVIAVGIVNGIQDIASLAMLAGLVVAAVALASIGNRADGPARYWQFKAAQITTAAMPALVFAKYVKDAIIYGSGLPTYVYWLDGVLFVMLALTLALRVFSRRTTGQFAGYKTSEAEFLMLSFFVLTFTMAQIYTGSR